MALSTLTSDLPLSGTTSPPLSTTTTTAATTATTTPTPSLDASNAHSCHLYAHPFTTLSADRILAAWLTLELLSLLLTIPVYALFLTSTSTNRPTHRPRRAALLRCTLATAFWALAMACFALSGCAISAARFCEDSAEEAAWVMVVAYVQWGVVVGAVNAGCTAACVRLWVGFRRRVRWEEKGKGRVVEVDVDCEGFWGQWGRGGNVEFEGVEMRELSGVTGGNIGKMGEKSDFQKEVDAIDKANEDVYAPSGSGSNRSSASSSQQQALEILEEIRIAAAKAMLDEIEASSRRGSRNNAGDSVLGPSKG